MALVAQEGCRTLERVGRSEPNPRPDIERQESASRSQHHSQAQQPSAGRCCVSLQAVISSLAAAQANAGQDVPAAIRAAGSAIVHERTLDRRHDPAPDHRLDWALRHDGGAWAGKATDSGARARLADEALRVQAAPGRFAATTWGRH